MLPIVEPRISIWRKKMWRRSSSGWKPAVAPHGHDPSAVPHGLDRLREHLAADVLDHDIDAALAGQSHGLRHEVLARVVDATSAPSAFARADFASVPAVAITRAP